MADIDGDPVSFPFSIRHARWRTWLRQHTPNWLYFRLGVVFPKARDCGEHDWYYEGRGLDACYHCRVTRPTQ